MPNHDAVPISYTIVASIETNSYFPAFPGASGMGGGAVGAGHGGMISSTVYHVTSTNDSGPGTLRTAVNASNRTVVFDVTGTINLLTPIVITNSYLTIAGQSAMCGGVTVAGQMTTVQSAHDVIIRDVRFRPGATASTPKLLNLDFNTGSGTVSPKRGPAAIGYNANDLWNLYSRDDGFGGYKATGSLANLLWSDGTASGINLNITNAPGAWPNTAPDYMFNTYLYPLPNGNGNIVFTLNNVPPATYDLYVYAHGSQTENGAVSLQIGANSYGPFKTAVGTVWSDPMVWQQGQQYIEFQGVTVSSLTDVIRVTVAPDSNIEAPLNGLQMIQTSASGTGGQADSLQFLNASNVIADHVSASWSANNLVSVLNSSNVTVQWSIMADSLYQTNSPLQGVGSLLRYGNGDLSFNHNLYADNFSGSPRVGDNLSLDFVNNVVYNWGLFPGFTGGTGDLLASPNGCTNQWNYTGNYLIAGADTANFATNYAITNIAFFGGATNNLAANWIFQTNNVIDSNNNHLLDGANTEWAMFTNQYSRFDQPFPLIPVPTDEAFLAYEKVLDFAGVNMCQRDIVDANIVAEVRNQSGRLISMPPSSSYGMVAWWPGDGNADDIIGTNNGIIIGGVGFVPGEVKQAFQVTGTSGQRVTVPDSPDFYLTNSLTIEGWFKANVLFGKILERGDQRPGFDPYVVDLLGDNGNLRFAITDSGNNSAVVQAPVTTGVWTHFAGTLDGSSGTLRLYTNGMLAAQMNTPIRPLGALISGQQPSIGIGNNGQTTINFPFNGLIDELTLYSNALTASEIKAIYDAGSAGKYALLTGPTNQLPYLDTDRDGIPDFWEITFGQNPTKASNNQLSTNVNYLGYTTLEEYLAWKAGPHALTITNTPVNVDLYQMFGDTGHLGFSVGNSLNGSVYLTNNVDTNGVVIQSNTVAVFTPPVASPPYSGYASFDVYVTNDDTVAYFGPVTVSVMVSAVPIVYANNTNSPPILATNLPDQDH